MAFPREWKVEMGTQNEMTDNLVVGVFQITAATILVMIDLDRLFTYTVVSFTENFPCFLTRASTRVASMLTLRLRLDHSLPRVNSGYLEPPRQSAESGSG